MSVLKYNGVELAFISTQSLRVEPEYDPTGVDQIATKYSLTVSAVLHQGVPPSVSQNETAAHIGDRIKGLLSTPRRPLLYENGGVTIINLQAPDGSEVARDDSNGPEPVVTMTSPFPGCWLVSFAVTVRLIECETQTRGFLSLKWSDTLNYAEDWTATRRRTGTLVLSQRLNQDAESYRPLITPPIPRGFRRASAEYVLNEAGTHVRFAFTDREMHTPPPFPALRMRGRMSESTPNGAVRMGRFDLTLDGPKGVPKADLLARAIAVGMGRVFAAGVDTGIGDAAGRVIMGGSISETLDDDKNSVSLSLSWKMAATSGRSKSSAIVAGTRAFARGVVDVGLAASGLGFLRALDTSPAPEPQPQPNAQGLDKAAIPVTAQWIGQPLAGSDPDQGIAPPLFGTADYVRLVAAALSDPCGVTAVLNESELRSGEFEFFSGESPDGSRTTATVVPEVDPDEESALYADDGTPGTYDHYTLVSTYRHDSGKVALPSTKKGEKKAEVQLYNESMDLTVEFSCARVGGPPVVPDPNEASDELMYKRGSVSAHQIELAGDGVTPIYRVDGLFEFEVLDPCSVSIAAPVPPYLDGQIGEEARIAVGRAGASLLFGPASRGDKVNLFCGLGIDVVGETTTELRGGAGPELPRPVGA